jgi:bifunctional non-homologous end joining protein LigD
VRQRLASEAQHVYIPYVRYPSDFIIPCSPTLRARPPEGDAWLHEIKFDGWRIQLHKRGRDVAIYTKNGHDYTTRLRSIAAAVAALPARSAIIDGELTGTDERGLPNFHALHFRRRSDDTKLCVWAFNLLEFNGRDLRELPLTKRKHSLEKLLKKSRNTAIRYSASFDDGEKLLAHAEALDAVMGPGPELREKWLSPD